LRWAQLSQEAKDGRYGKNAKKARDLTDWEGFTMSTLGVHRPLFLLLVLPALSLLPAGQGAEPQAQPEQLPTPRTAAPEPAPVVLPPAYFRRSHYDVWQNYSVDRTGHFRPRVNYSPYGSYYRYNGQPYPWISTHSRDFASYVQQ
jgi:hypothetical protein